MLVAKGQLDGAVLVKLAPVEPQVLLQRLGDELPLVERGFCFSRHGGWFVVVDLGFCEAELERAGIEALVLLVVLEGQVSAADDR